MIPKIELHLHLEGAAPPAFIRALAARKGIDAGPIFDARGGYRFEGFAQFLQTYQRAASLLTTPADYAALLRAVLEACGAQGAVYVETFVSPDFCGGGDLAAWRDYLAAMEEVAAQMAADGVESRAVATAVRHHGPYSARQAASCAAETGSADGTGWLAGFGLAGAESAGQARDFAWAFDCAREAGLGLTAHAGEWEGPAKIREVLAALRPARLGHGVRAIEDPALVRDLAEAGTHLEVCPGSNVALGVYSSIAAHPVARLVEAGCRVSISTDDPPFFHTTLEQEYAALAEAFGWAEAEFAQMNRWAIEDAFCDTRTKARLMERFA